MEWYWPFWLVYIIFPFSGLYSLEVKSLCSRHTIEMRYYSLLHLGWGLHSLKFFCKRYLSPLPYLLIHSIIYLCQHALRIFMGLAKKFVRVCLYHLTESLNELFGQYNTLYFGLQSNSYLFIFVLKLFHLWPLAPLPRWRTLM